MTKLSEKEQKEIKKDLPFGAFTKIASEKNISVSLAHAIFHGKRTDHCGVVKRAIEIAMEKIKEEEEAKAKVSREFKNYEQLKKKVS
jgi:hypothetical protein